MRGQLWSAGTRSAGQLGQDLPLDVFCKPAEHLASKASHHVIHHLEGVVQPTKASVDRIIARLLVSTAAAEVEAANTGEGVLLHVLIVAFVLILLRINRRRSLTWAIAL